MNGLHLKGLTSEEKGIVSADSSERAINEAWLSQSTHETDKGLDDDLDEPETAVDGWGRHGEWELVGQGDITNPSDDSKQCGKFYGFNACLNVDLHNKTLLTSQGVVNHAGHIFATKRFRYCCNPRCPTCYRHGWAVQGAHAIVEILEEASKKHGKPEHIVCSIPSSMYSLEFDDMKKKARKVLAGQGVLGGCLIFHAFRYRKYDKRTKDGILLSRGWYWSPHFHVIGFIKGGFSRCRHCHNYDDVTHEPYIPETCYGCDGLCGVSRRDYHKNGGIIVKVEGERKTLFGTAWYQLEHSSLKPDKKHFNIVSWFGCCAPNKLQRKPREKGSKVVKVCPICGHDLIPVRYVGADLANILKEFWNKEFEDTYLDERGVPKWIPKPESRYGC